MPKAYWIAHVTITNPERYKDYITLNAAAFKKYNARFDGEWLNASIELSQTA